MRARAVADGQQVDIPVPVSYTHLTLNIQNKNVFMESEERYDEALNILVVFEIPHPFPLNTHFGTLAGGLGSFPFDYPTYLV